MFSGLTIGLDVVDVGTIEESLERFGGRYLDRVYTPREIAYALAANDPATRARRLAARFAAKEAALKALCARERGIPPRAIEVVRSDDGSIALELSGAALAAARETSAASLSLSVSHEGKLAVAVVICTRVKP